MIEVPVASRPRALRFYVETLGIKLVAERPSCSVLDVGQGARLALVEVANGPRRVAIGLAVADVERTVALLENRGVVFRSEVHAGMAASTFDDLDGNTLYLFEDATP